MHPTGERAAELRDRKTQQFDVSGFALSKSLLALSHVHTYSATCTHALLHCLAHACIFVEVDTTDLQYMIKFFDPRVEKKKFYFYLRFFFLIIQIKLFFF